MRQRDAAICLRAVDYSETSQVLRFLTRAEGIVNLMGKGTKRPKSAAGGAIDLMAEGDLVYIPHRREGLGTLVEFAETISRRDLRADAGRLNAALYAVELTSDALAEDDPHPDVFDLLHNLLARLAKPDAPVPAVVAYFQWRLMRNVGLLGQMNACVGCGTAAVKGPRTDVYFSSSQGGLLCRSCCAAAAEKYAVDDHALLGIAALASAEAGRKVSLHDPQALAVNRLLDYHITYQLGRRLKMSRHVID